MDQTLTGKTALATAAANGIDRAKPLSVQEAHVIATGIGGHAVDPLAPTSPDSTGDQLRVPDGAAVAELGPSHPSIQILPNCDDTVPDRLFDLNAKVNCPVTKAVPPGVPGSGSGSIINTAADFVKDGIRRNTICPGTLQSPSLNDRLTASGDCETALAVDGGWSI